MWFDQAMNMKLLLCTFEQLLGMKIKFYKSEILCFKQAKKMWTATLIIIWLQIRHVPRFTCTTIVTLITKIGKELRSELKRSCLVRKGNKKPSMGGILY